METKVMDYKPELVRDKLVEVFKKRKGEATAADLVALTGLPKPQIDLELKAVSDEYGARLKVTESGELLYSFPEGMRSRYRGFGPSLKRFWKGFRKGAALVGTWLFKAWIMLMLVGYFALFVGLAVLAFVASFALQASGKGGDREDRRGGSGLGGLWLTSRVFETIIRIWFYSELFKDPRDRAYERGVREEKRRNKRPLHKAVFSFVFGDGDPNSAYDEVEKKAIVAFIQANKGIMTMPEFLALTGLPPLEAEERINRYLVEFEGSPEVSQEGGIYYFFPSLLRRADKRDRSFGGASPLKRLGAFSANPKKLNKWFVAINAANILFGSYFLWGALTIGMPVLVNGTFRIPSGFGFFYTFTTAIFSNFLVANSLPLVTWGLGVVPLAFSAFFYAIPALRSRRLARENEALRVDNLRKIAYRAVLDAPEALRPEAIPATLDEAKPRDAKAAEKILVTLAAHSGGVPTEGGAYSYPEIARTQAEAAKARAAVRESDYELGASVFDSHA